MRLFEGTQFDIPPTCDRCGRLEADCECPPPAKEWKPTSEQRARIQTEKRKKGKTVTVVLGLKPEETDFTALLRQLKSTCGAGGSIQEDQIEIQGKHVERVGLELRRLGYQVRG